MNKAQEAFAAMMTGAPYPKAADLDRPRRSMDEIIAEWEEKLERETDPVWQTWLKLKINGLKRERDASNRPSEASTK